MNKKRTAKAVLAAFGLSIALPTAAFAATDTNGHWAEGVLDKWEQKGLIGGYADGTIRPDNAITRAEFVSLVNRVAGFNTASQSLSFNDVSADDWYATQVAIAVNEAYIGGYPDNTFRPNDYVTRAQAASMIARFIGLAEDEARAAQFADAKNNPDWAIGVIGAVANAGYMIGDENNNFNAQNALTRAEAVAALDRIFGEMKTLEASLSATNGTVAVGGTKAITVTAPQDAKVTAVSTNEKTATVAVSGHTITITGKASGNATIAITVSAPGYADAKLTYSVHVASGGAIGGGGGGTSSTSPEVITDKENITVPEGYDHSEVVIKTLVNRYAATDAKDAVTYVYLPENLEVESVTLPAGSQFSTTIGGKTYDMTLTKDLTRTTVGNITVEDIKDVILEGSEAYEALSTLEADRELITCTQDSAGHLHWFIDGKTWREQVEVFEMLEVTLVEIQ